MGILPAFAPFLVFGVVDRFVGPTEGLIAASVTSAALIARDWQTPGRSPKILEIGTFVLIAGLGIYTLIAKPAWSVVGVRLCVDAGLLLIILVSMAIRKPFTLQYARESVPKEHWDSPVFVRTNYVISAAWALAFVAIIVAELVLIYIPSVNHRVGVIVIVAALVGAVKFSGWYPSRVARTASADRR